MVGRVVDEEEMSGQTKKKPVIWNITRGMRQLTNMGVNLEMNTFSSRLRNRVNHLPLASGGVPFPPLLLQTAVSSD